VHPENTQIARNYPSHRDQPLIDPTIKLNDEERVLRWARRAGIKSRHLLLPASASSGKTVEELMSAASSIPLRKKRLAGI
jgi:hypothetical protein